MKGSAVRERQCQNGNDVVAIIWSLEWSMIGIVPDKIIVADCSLWGT